MLDGLTLASPIPSRVTAKVEPGLPPHNLELVYIATRNRVVFGAADLDALRAALGGFG